MKIFELTKKKALSFCLLILLQSLQLTANAEENKSAKSDKVTDTGSVVAHDSKTAVSASSEPMSPGQGRWVLKAEQWELARSGDYVLSLSVVNNIVNVWLEDKQKTIEIQYPGGEEGEFWVQELFDWLVALGVPSANIVTTPGSGAVDVIRFGLIN